MERRTEQREAMKKVFDEAKRPLTAQEVLDLAQEHVPGLGIATVYRNLKAFVDEGVLTPVDLPGEPSRYESVDLEHHHHFQCDACGLVFDIPGCPNIKSIVPEDYEVTRHEILMYGVCPTCKAA
ncbi:transcriptional repressor [Persicimonas caeni]|jgi:Fur family ferric uptake transcriptional regulator|uniref:Transcriptional repressor n=1 Tax=Persicimonas caeni TaxID=2292766 RepID=A0A4Y6PXR0_PERCE|nr:transcriptional repressor [Persicimonas caeni]QDG53106.1 transcriptional repressor [Persicimonas caeni]QED34328.1 transcriptional repressor [Persicimonas caeni]